MFKNIQPYISATWRAKNLEDIISGIMDESSIRNPIHRRRLDLLRAKRNVACHYDFLMKLEEICKLVEYVKMTGAAFLKHLLLEQSDRVMRKIATDILSSKPESGIDFLCSKEKQTEASMWYDNGGSRSAKVARGPRWCENCKSSTHDMAQCWGICDYCHHFGHRSSRCRENP